MYKMNQRDRKKCYARDLAIAGTNRKDWSKNSAIVGIISLADFV